MDALVKELGTNNEQFELRLNSKVERVEDNKIEVEGMNTPNK